jgi:hypothetical protein
MPRALCTLLGIDIFPDGFQSSPEMVFLMRFEGVDRFQMILREEFKELIEIKTPFPYGEMFIHFSVIIVEVSLDHVLSEGFEPGGERGLVENVVMTGVETESKMG